MMSSYILKAKLTDKSFLPIIDICDYTIKENIHWLSDTPEHQKEETKKQPEAESVESAETGFGKKRTNEQNAIKRFFKLNKIKIDFNANKSQKCRVRFRKKIKKAPKNIFARCRPSKMLMRQSADYQQSPSFVPTIISRFISVGDENNVPHIGVIYTLDFKCVSDNSVTVLPQKISSRINQIKVTPDLPAQHHVKPDKYKRVPIMLKCGWGRRKMPIHFQSECEGYCVYDTQSLTNYCVNWCREIYATRVAVCPIKGTDTFVLTIAGRENYFIQFVYGDDKQSRLQQLFQAEIEPVKVYIFKNFQDFALFMKDKIKYDA